MATIRQVAVGRAAVVAPLAILFALSCGGPDRGATGAGPSSIQLAPGRGEPDTHKQGTPMDIRLVVNDIELRGSLDDTAAGRDLASLLPLTLELSDFHSTEKIADLPRSLETTGAPSGTAATAGAVTYYAPWGNLAIFYRDFRYSDGLVRLGRLAPGAADVFADQDYDFAITIEVIDEVD